MIQTIRKAWGIPELRKKIIFTLLILLIFRIGNAITVPYVDVGLLETYLDQMGGTILGLYNVMSGGAFAQATVFALSIQPYINASIIIQLLTVAIPALERLAKDGGEEGRKKIQSITRYTTVGIAILQAVGYYFMMRNYNLLASDATGIWPALVIVVAFEVLTGGVLLKPNSFVSLIQQNAYVIILAIGMVMVIIATHIDLSVGSLVAFIGGVCALLMERAGVNWMLAIVIALVVGLIVGVWQGFWVAVIGIPGFITTLAGMLIFRGLATVIVGESVPITSLEFRGIARNYLPNILGWWGPFDGLTIVLGILCIVGFAWSQLRKRARVAKVGLVPEPMSLTVLKIVLAAVVIAFVTYLLASSGNADQGGTPIMLVIVGVLVLI